jgi:hypothetical protein
VRPTGQPPWQTRSLTYPVAGSLVFVAMFIKVHYSAVSSYQPSLFRH